VQQGCQSVNIHPKIYLEVNLFSLAVPSPILKAKDSSKTRYRDQRMKYCRGSSCKAEQAHTSLC